MFRFFILLIIAHTNFAYEIPAPNWTIKESYLRNWALKIKFPTGSSYTYGMLMGAQHFLTFSPVPANIKHRELVYVTNELHVPLDPTRIHLKTREIYYGMEFSRYYDKSQNQFAVISTIIPTFIRGEDANNLFIKIAKHIGDVDGNSCFVFGSNNSYIGCKIDRPELINDNDKSFQCAIDFTDKAWKQSGLFCKPKDNSDIVLVGLVSNGFYEWKETGQVYKNVINLVGYDIGASNHVLPLEEYKFH